MHPGASKNREREGEREGAGGGALPVLNLKEQGAKHVPESREYWRGVEEASLAIASVFI